MECISLIADENHLRDRLSKDVEAGIRSEEIIERSIARIPLYASLDTFKLDTSSKEVPEIVDEIKRIGSRK